MKQKKVEYLECYNDSNAFNCSESTYENACSYEELLKCLGVNGADIYPRYEKVYLEVELDEDGDEIESEIIDVDCAFELKTIANHVGIDIKFLEAVIEYKCYNKSPYSNSFYNAKVDWDNKPEGSIRISDHWSFTTYHDDRIHCQLNLKSSENLSFNYEEDEIDIQEDLVCKFENGRYNVIEEL